MPRRSGRLSEASNGELATSKHKRTASGSNGAATVAKRPKKQKQQATPTKSQYFNDEDEDEAELDDSETPSADDTASDFEDGSAEPEEPDEDVEDEDEDDSDEASSNPRSSKASTKIWRPGTKTGLGPGKQLIIKKPKARPAGKTPYSDETVHPNTMDFLGDLKANNDRQWLKMHDAEFRQAEKDWHSFVEKMTEKLTEIDDTIPELPVKDVVFRIYRDVRFSKDPTPYKPWFSAAWSRTGRKSTYAHYYIQIAPKKCLVVGGLYMPEAPSLNKMRRKIDSASGDLKQVLLNDDIRREFLSNAKKNDAVKAFIKSNNESALKTKPKGFDADHPDLNLLRLKSYTLAHKLSDEEVLGTKGAARVSELLGALKPWITFCNSVVMPDEPESASDESSNDEDDDEGDGTGASDAADEST